MSILLFLTVFLLGSSAQAQFSAAEVPSSALETGAVEPVSADLIGLAPMTEETGQRARMLLANPRTTALVLAFDLGRDTLPQRLAAFHLETTIERLHPKGVLLRPAIVAAREALPQRSHWVVLVSGPEAAKEMAKALEAEGHEIGILKNMLRAAGVSIGRLARLQDEIFDGAGDEELLSEADALTRSRLPDQGRSLGFFLRRAVPDSASRYGETARRRASGALRTGLAPFKDAADLMSGLAPSDRADLQGVRLLEERAAGARRRLEGGNDGYHIDKPRPRHGPFLHAAAVQAE